MQKVNPDFLLKEEVQPIQNQQPQQQQLTPDQIVQDILAVNEGVSDIINKVVKYGKMGMLTLAILFAVAGNVNAETAKEVTKTGVEYLKINEKQAFYNMMIGAAIGKSKLATDLQDKSDYLNIRTYYWQEREGQTPIQLSSSAQAKLNELFNTLKSMDDSKRNELIQVGMQLKTVNPN